eukprot:scaffold2213_cov444-Prasinococcus_capsulatus_cf.AAC.10
MYAVKVTGAAFAPPADGSKRKEEELSVNGGDDGEALVPREGGRGRSGVDVDVAATEELLVSCGAKGLEVVHGALHLFRETTATQQENSHLYVATRRGVAARRLLLPQD